MPRMLVHANRSSVKLNRVIAVAFGFVVFAAPAFAQEGGGDITTSQTGVLFRWINFAIVAGLILWFSVKGAAPFFRKHAAEISEKIAEGKRAREAAARQRQAAAEKMAGIDAEIAQIRTDAKRSAEIEAKRLRDLARDEAEAIDRAARAEIEAAQRAAKMELRAMAAELAIARAESVLRGELTPDAEAALFRTFVAEVTGSPN